MKKVKIDPVPGTSIAEDKEVAGELRDKVIIPALDDGEKVEVDFQAVDTATQSYVHALIADAIRRHGDKSFELLEFSNCTPAVQAVVKTVFGYTLFATETADPISGDSDQSD
ncbi:MAG TPA: DUF4325 domain-containing protein [Solirubrobacterales bacterium]|nr:DUF4325 domain-containing protein [Solirubrobacterales bacterium]